MQSYLMLLTVLAGLSVSSCSTPHIQPADPKLLFDSELLGFIEDGATKREEVVLRLGIPSAQFEGERILTYQFRVDQAGKWHLVAPQIDTFSGLRAWPPGTLSLVLVFDKDGVLHQHSLVEAK